MKTVIGPRTSKHWSRRSLLRTLALGVGGASYAATARRELTVFAGARAAALAQPKRLLVLWSPNGIHQTMGGRDWLVPGTGTKDFTLGPITAPLEKHRKNVVFFENLTFLTDADAGDAHGSGKAISLTGSHIFYDGKNIMPTGPSIDYYIGEKVGRIATPQFPSVQLTLQQKDTPAWASYGPKGSFLPAIDSPWKLYDKLFGNLPRDGAAKPDPALLTRLALRKSVLDLVAKDVAAFKKTLPLEDRARADAQLDAIETLEQRLMPPAPKASCSAPALPTPFDPYDTSKYHLLLRATADTLIGAFACDLTRVGFINLRDGGWQPQSNFPPINSPQWEHIMSHDYQDVFIKLKAWYMSDLVSYVADRLNDIPEGDGTMLDNTIILWATEISTGHQWGRMPWLTLGGKNLGVNVGNHLRLPVIAQNQPKVDVVGKPANHDRTEKGYPQTRLFVSMLHAFGIQEDSFGLPQYGTGPMDGYLTT